MQSTLRYIGAKKRGFARHAFFASLRDRSRSPDERFAFAPALAPFVMAFADLNNFSLRVPHPQTTLDEIINRHSEEDATHFEVYLEDLETLEASAPASLSKTLAFLWSPERRCCRQTCYALAALLASTQGTLRLVIVEAIEATGAVAFDAFSELAAEYQAATGKELHYFGKHHKALETGHTMGTDDIEARLHTLLLAPDERLRAERLVDEVFELFAAMMEELHRYAPGFAASSRPADEENEVRL